MITYKNGIHNRHSTTADRAKGYYGQDRYPRSIPQPLILLELGTGNVATNSDMSIPLLTLILTHSLGLPRLSSIF